MGMSSGARETAPTHDVWMMTAMGLADGNLDRLAQNHACQPTRLCQLSARFGLRAAAEVSPRSVPRNVIAPRDAFIALFTTTSHALLLFLSPFLVILLSLHHPQISPWLPLSSSEPLLCVPPLPLSRLCSPLPSTVCAPTRPARPRYAAWLGVFLEFQWLIGICAS